MDTNTDKNTDANTDTNTDRTARKAGRGRDRVGHKLAQERRLGVCGEILHCTLLCNPICEENLHCTLLCNPIFGENLCCTLLCNPIFGENLHCTLGMPLGTISSVFFNIVQTALDPPPSPPRFEHLCCGLHCGLYCQIASIIIQNVQQKFLNMGLTPPSPFEQCLKKHPKWYPGTSLRPLIHDHFFP